MSQWFINLYSYLIYIIIQKSIVTNYRVYLTSNYKVEISRS